MISDEFAIVFYGYSLLPIRTPAFARKNYELCTIEYVLSGRGFLEVNGKNYEIGPDTVYILHKHSNHKYWHDKNDPWQKIYFLFDGSILDQMFRYYGLNDVYYIPGCASCKDLFLSLYDLKEKHLQSQDFLLFHQLLEQLSRIYTKKGSNQGTIAGILKQTLDASIQKDFLLHDYAKQTGFSEGHLIRVFRQAYGTTPHLYLLELRLQMAKMFLLYSNRSVKEIAELLCFANQYYFSNVFKQKYNSSPQIFRNKYRE